MAKKSSSYFIEQQGAGWAVCYHKLSVKTTLCRTEKKEDADAIQLAMNIYPYAQKAAGELVDNVQDGPGQQDLIDIFNRLHAMERKAAIQRDIEAFFTNIGQVAMGIMAGIGILTLIVMLIRYFLL